MMMLSEGVVEVEKEKLAACMTCPICKKLLVAATTISECLHSFCWKCIYDKINDKEIDACPVCNIDLGGAPLERLRPDHNLQDLRAKIFPSPRKNSVQIKVSSWVSALGVPLVQSTYRRKERTLSSLEISTPKVSARSPTSEKRSKSGTRKTPALEERAAAVEKLTRKGSASISSSPKNLTEKTQRSRHVKESSPITKSLKDQIPQKDREAGCEPGKGEADDMWKSLNQLVEAATNTMSIKEENLAKVSHCDKLKADGNEKNSTASSLNLANSQGLHKTRASMSDEQSVAAQAVVNAKFDKSDGTPGPIWFTLVACNNQKEAAPLPQISSCYLRVKDGSMPISYIKRYIVQKLGLTSEAEVEIMLRGQPLLSTMQLHTLFDWWLKTVPSASERIHTTVGSSAKDFVMVLSYARKVVHNP